MTSPRQPRPTRVGAVARLRARYRERQARRALVKTRVRITR